MTRPANITADLLEAGWPVLDVEFAGLDGTGRRTFAITVRTPPIAIDSNDPRLAHLIARAMQGAKEH